MPAGVQLAAVANAPPVLLVQLNVAASAVVASERDAAMKAKTIGWGRMMHPRIGVRNE
jgi:hypothetical protein